MAWKRGQSGNPGGRRKELEAGCVRDLARQHTAAAINALVAALKAKSDRTRVAAAEAILDRGWGKPTQAITGENGGPISVYVENDKTIIERYVREKNGTRNS